MSNEQHRLSRTGLPASSVRRERGMIDARTGKPVLSRDKDYRRGYELGQFLEGADLSPPDAPDLRRK